MTLREQFQEVLQKHSRYELNYPGHPTPLVCQIAPVLLDDLCACVPSPVHHLAFPAMVAASFLSPSLGHDLMAWATGQKTKKVWCKHIQDDNPDNNPEGSTHPYWVEVKQLETGEFIKINTATHWKFCPVCATPRPESSA